MKHIKLLTSLIFSACFAATPLLADDAEELDKAVENVDKLELKTKPHEESFENVSKETGVPEPELERQHEKTKMGSGSLFIANTLAKETGKSFDEIVALKKTGNGWGKIAKDNGVKLGPIVSKAKKMEKERVAMVTGKGGDKKKGNQKEKNKGPHSGKKSAGDKSSKPEKGSKGKKK